MVTIMKLQISMEEIKLTKVVETLEMEKDFQIRYEIYQILFFVLNI